MEAEAKVNEPEEGADTDKEKEEEKASQAAGKPRPDVTPEPRPGFLQRWGMPLLLGALLIAALAYFLSHIGADDQRKQYEMALDKAKSATVADSIVHYAGKAFKLGETNEEKNEARKWYDKGIEAFNLQIQELKDKAAMLSDKEDASYVDFFQAEKKLADASLMLDKYPREAGLAGTRSDIKTAMDSLEVKIGGFSTKDKVTQLLTKAEELCKEGNGEEADEYYGHAANLIGKDEKLRKTLASSQEKCNPPVATRSLEPATKTPKPSTPSATKETARMADATTEAKPETTATVSKVKPNKAQLEYLEKGIALFEKQRLSNSQYEAKKAAEYLEKAGPARTGAAAYMLSVLYNEGKGVEEDEKKAITYAQESALQGYPGGHYLYAALLLDNENAVDSVTAKKSLNIAASKGHPEATNLLYELMQPAARLRP
jgi:TPR repeat protein